MNKRDRIVKSGIIVLVITIIAKLAALGEDAVVASFMGTSDSADSYYMSADIIQLFWYFGTLGIVRVFLPEYKRQSTLYGEDAAEQYSRNMMAIFSWFVVAITVAILLLADVIVDMAAYGFTEENKALCASYTRYRTPQIIFWCWTSILTAKLQARKKYSASKIPEIIVHAPVIVLALLLYNAVGVQSLFWGLIIGSILGFLSQLICDGKRHSLSVKFSLKDRGVIDSLKRMPAAFVSAALAQIHSMVDKVMASAQPSGAVSSLSYGHKMYAAVNGLISGAITTVVYPKITELATVNDKDQLSQLMKNVQLLFAGVMVPVAIGLTLFSADFTKVLFMRGAFGEESVSQVAFVFSAYVLGIPFAGMNSIVQLVYFAYGNTKSPMLISLVSIAGNLVLNYVLSQLWGVGGIAIASSIAMMVACIVSIILVRKYVAVVDRKFLVDCLIVVLLALISCFVAWMITNWTVPASMSLVRLIMGGMIGVLIYLGLVYGFKRELIHLLKKL